MQFLRAQEEIDVIDLKKVDTKKTTTTQPVSKPTLTSTTKTAPVTTTTTTTTPEQKSYTYNPSTSVVSRTDTLRMYSVYLEARPTPFGTMYMANGKEIKREKYEEYKNSWEVTASCKPCTMYTFDANDKIKIISFQHGTCLCGEYTEYYGDGTPRVKGQFQQNATGDWNNMKERGLCNIREGSWYYYLPNKNIDKIEVYENGVLQRVEKGQMPIAPLTGNNISAETNGQKGLLNKLKDK
jgi:antitoxin component YwqK of YwqJK toxin-antitoxin module